MDANRSAKKRSLERLLIALIAGVVGAVSGSALDGEDVGKEKRGGGGAELISLENWRGSGEIKFLVGGIVFLIELRDRPCQSVRVWMSGVLVFEDKCGEDLSHQEKGDAHGD